ncbi:uncharacterized protein B0T15DRAFT_120162 [Chaetomium strumarium]|uniref:Uncharacterized protein n=1 Tax=Chaetomium strumarium TaxID=1170767 RepID=A0AAJ0M4K2_9PEZI|nr:hypothetical protein B0T15DRAFT_120162 [Chaetomium strumarium]
MVKYAFVAFAGMAAALPLNINLGAYSPALVVGDGEISFGGRQDVSNLITALEGAAVNAAAGAAANTGAGAGAGAGANTGEGASQVVAAAAAGGPVASTVAAPTPVPDTTENAATDPALAQQAQQIAGLQGLGKAKAIAPRIGADESPKMDKRDIAGFDRALKYAEAALTKGPKVQLGTGAEGSGVGIIVDNNANTAAAQPGAQPGAEAKKRDVAGATAPRRRAKVTTMYVRRGIPEVLRSPSDSAAIAARAPGPAPAPAPAPAQVAAAAEPVVPVSVSKRAESTFDAVNLNVDAEAGVTMTFVESLDDDEEEVDA